MSALDDRIELARLVPPSELDELVTAITRALGGDLAIFDRAGVRIAGSESAGPAARVFEHHGAPLARLAASGPRADASLALCAETLELLIHHAYARELAAATHEEAMRATFAELTEHNNRLSRAVARLEELDRLKSNFLATMSHELRTPLTSVIGYAEMMSEGLAGPVSYDQREYLTTILGKADQLLGLITAVLDVSSIESGQLALERTTLSLGDLVQSELATFAPQAGRRGIAIQFEAGPDTIVVGDRRKLRQVVSSLVSNAVKFTPDSGKVSVCVRRGPLAGHDPGAGAGPGYDDEDGPGIQLVVRDSGIGISRDQVAKIFEPFFQVDSSSTRAFGGTGLGLTLAKAYVEAHGGRIWVETSPGQGSTFTATFPALSGDDRRSDAGGDA
ncbi:MAG TPA: HAMP domain-containing sensor histidine kinase [Kofleriaceae bacterium]|nr:HAMP domain-containing sensor histidine kinase [Kofleriaceae bacterium]